MVVDFIGIADWSDFVCLSLLWSLSRVDLSVSWGLLCLVLTAVSLVDRSALALPITVWPIDTYIVAVAPAFALCSLYRCRLVICSSWAPMI